VQADLLMTCYHGSVTLKRYPGVDLAELWENPRRAHVTDGFCEPRYRAAAGKLRPSKRRSWPATRICQACVSRCWIGRRNCASSQERLRMRQGLYRRLDQLEDPKARFLEAIKRRDPDANDDPIKKFEVSAALRPEARSRRRPGGSDCACHWDWLRRFGQADQWGIDPVQKYL